MPPQDGSKNGFLFNSHPTDCHFTFLQLLLGIDVVHLHSLPLVQEVKTSFRESGIDISAFTYSDVEEYREIKAGLRANPVR